MKCCIASCLGNVVTVYYGFALCEDCRNEAYEAVEKDALKAVQFETAQPMLKFLLALEERLTEEAESRVAL